MITTRRFEQDNSNYTKDNLGGVSVLTRSLQNSTTNTQEKATTNAQDRERMRSNLEKLLGYDTVAELTRQKEESKVEMAQKEQTLEINEEDICPSSTTMQFTEDNSNAVIGDMNTKQEESVSYHLNKKGKIAIAVFAVVATVIMALIIVNTAVLSNLGSAVFAKQAELNATITEYNNLVEENQEISSEAHIRNVAENEYKMIIGD